MENLNNFIIKKGNIVFDMDEVLFNISPYMYKKVRLNWNEFFMYLKDIGPLKDEDILNREEFLISDWLLKERIKESILYEDLKKSIDRKINEFCFVDDMYDRIQPTKLCQNTLLNEEFLSNPAVNSCIILTRANSDYPGMKEAKEKTFKKYFNHPKIRTIIIDREETKSEALTRAGVDWTLFVDDEIRNTRDLAENFDLQKREFLIPKFGYNEMPLELSFLITEKGGTISYYDPA